MEHVRWDPFQLLCDAVICIEPGNGVCAMGQGRIKWIDFAKGMTMLFIFNTHFAGDVALFPWGKAFHVVTYFILSGILMAEKQEELQTGSVFWKRKVKGLLWPYLTLSIVTPVIVCIGYLLGGQRAFRWMVQTVGLNLVGFGNGTIWFLVTAFAGECLVYLLIRKMGKWSPLAALLLFAGGMAVIGGLTQRGYTGYHPDLSFGMAGRLLHYAGLGVLRIPVAFGFVFAGFLADRAVRRKNLVLSKPVAAIIGSICGIAFVFWMGPALKGCDLHYAYILHPVLYPVFCVTGAVMIIAWSYALEDVVYVSDGAQWIGRNSIYFMTTHYDFKILPVLDGILRYVGLGAVASGTVVGLVLMLLLLLIECGVTWLILHTPLQWLYHMPKCLQKRLALQ